MGPSGISIGAGEGGGNGRTKAKEEACLLCSKKGREANGTEAQ